MSVKIVIDSTTNVKENIKDSFVIVPLTLSFGQEQYIDGVTINHKMFYEKLIECDTLPVTSQATPADWDEKFKAITENGDTVIAITLSSTLSGTYQSALIAASEYPEKVFVVDSSSVAIGAGILAEYALDLVNQGFDAKTIAEHLEKKKQYIKIVALLDTLEYLKKGGRISKTVAFAGGLLNIKPVISLELGEINMLGKARGSKQGNNLLVQEIEKSGEVDFEKPILLGYTGLTDNLLLKYMEDSSDLWKNDVDKLDYCVIGSVIGTHVGPGAIAVAFFSK